MKIGIDCRIFSAHYGIGRYVSELVLHLSKIPSLHQYILFFNDPEFEAFECPNSKWTKVRVNAAHYSLSEQIKFLSILNRQNLDLMHFTHFNTPLLYLRPSMVTIHDLILHKFPDKYYTKRSRSLKKWIRILAYRLTVSVTARKAKHIIAVSENTKKDLITELNINPNKISVVYEGVGEEFCSLKCERSSPNCPPLKPFLRSLVIGGEETTLAKMKQANDEEPQQTGPVEAGPHTSCAPEGTGEEKVESQLSPQTADQPVAEAATGQRSQVNHQSPYLLYSGNWRVHKNLLNLIKAFNWVKKKKPNLTLVITGENDPDYPEIPSLIDQLGLAESIITPGVVTEQELINLYSNAELFVFPSRYEGFGLPPLEAMACGTPVVAANTSCVPEICGKAALYFDPETPEDIASKMLSVLDDQSLRNKLIASGTENLKRFSWKRMAQTTWHLYEKAA